MHLTATGEWCRGSLTPEADGDCETPKPHEVYRLVTLLQDARRLPQAGRREGNPPIQRARLSEISRVFLGMFDAFTDSLAPSKVAARCSIWGAGGSNESRGVATGDVRAGSGCDGSVLCISEWLRENLRRLYDVRHRNSHRSSVCISAGRLDSA
jgi:hypothetical protein